MTETPLLSPTLRSAAQQIRNADASAFLVPPRIVRRVIREDCELPGLGFHVPHWKSYIIPGERLRKFVIPEELGLPGIQYFPERVILIAEPKESELLTMNRDELFRWTWRLLFHARIHCAIDDRFNTQELTNADLHARIHQIGQSEFTEAHTILEKEHFLVGETNLQHVYTEFAAVFLEYFFFSPWRLPWWFPSLDDPQRILQIFGLDIDVQQLLEQTRQGGLTSPISESATEEETEENVADENENVAEGKTETTETFSSAQFEPQAEAGIKARIRRTVRRHKAIQQALRAEQSENTVRAAIAYSKASQLYDEKTDPNVEDSQKNLQEQVTRLLDRFVERLQAALEFDEQDAKKWRGTLSLLFSRSIKGFWNADRRLLYDLQKVCLDHERDVFRIDLLEIVRSLGKRPIKRALPNQREVLMVKHLRSASRRLSVSSLSDVERKEFDHLLHEAVVAAETQMRAHLRPAIQQTLESVGFRPRNVPEEVAAKKMVEELLDAVVQRGYFTMGILRDCISRNQLKLPNLGNPLTLVVGDRLLKADRQLGQNLDGVYRRGEFYLRWLQRLSSLCFGTVVGRLLTLYLFIPFGGAFVVLKALALAVDKIGVYSEHFTAEVPVALTGIFFLGVVHWKQFRKTVLEGLSWAARLLGSILIDMPTWAFRNPAIRKFLHQPEVVFVRRFIATPLLLMALFCFAIPATGIYRQASFSTALVVYGLFTFLLNTRMGRDVEELTTDWVEHVWFRLRTRFLVAIFDLIMQLFQSLLEVFERLLYAVDEWLRFKSGESRTVFWTKAVFGLCWAFVSFVTIFVMTLLVEPQINPIKHFPVVTVSHKIILPMQPGLTDLLIGTFGATTANFVALAIVTTTPGIFGFLVWELRSNWRLYATNRPKIFLPAVVGSHGETLIRLMKPGFHSGTLPKLFNKMRRAGRRDKQLYGQAIPPKYLNALHHIEQSIHQFVDREFLESLRKSDLLENGSVHVENILLSSNSISIKLQRQFSPQQFADDGTEANDKTEAGSEPLEIVFQEQFGWLVVGIRNPGWLAELPDDSLRAITGVLSVFYKLSGVDFVREQIESGFEKPVQHYALTERALTVWTDDTFKTECRYSLETRPQLLPIQAAGSSATDLSAADLSAANLSATDSPEQNTDSAIASVAANKIIYTEQEICWRHWLAFWSDIMLQKETASEDTTAEKTVDSQQADRLQILFNNRPTLPIINLNRTR